MELVAQDGRPGLAKVATVIDGLPLEKGRQCREPLGCEEQVLRGAGPLLVAALGREGAGEAATQFATIDGNIGQAGENLPEEPRRRGVLKAR